jgi:hypothetical protein
MQILEGPFHFRVDDIGRVISWNDLDSHIRSELESDGTYSSGNSSVYYCKVNVIPAALRSGKNHDWGKVKRVFIDVKPSIKSISIFGISPRNRKQRQMHQGELSFENTIRGMVRLFEVFQTDIEIKGPLKGLVGNHQFAVVSTFDRSYAQWMFTDMWDGIEFQLFIYVAVPNSLVESSRFIEMNIYPTLKKYKGIAPGFCHTIVRFPKEEILSA